MNTNESFSTQPNGDQVKGRSWSDSCLKVIGVIIIFIVALAVALPYIARFGFCHDWWLKSSPWAHYWWLCDCGSEFERSLYPDNVEIIISACYAPHAVTLSLDGRYMIVSMGTESENYLFNLSTDQRQLWSHHIWKSPALGFRTNTLVLIKGGDNSFKLVDVTDGSVINLTTFTAHWRDQALEVPIEALQAFQGADRVLMQTGTSVALALSSNLKDEPNYALHSLFQDELETIFSENGIEYEKSHPCWRMTREGVYKEFCPSYNGA